MRFRQGVQTELLISLALIMFTATALLLLIFLEINRSRTEDLHDLLARGFLAESQRIDFVDRGFEDGVWWRLDAEGRITASSGANKPLDDEARTLGLTALEIRSPHVQSGPPWAPIRFAAPSPDRESVLVGRIDEPISGLALAGLILIDVSIFGFFGFQLLRRRVVGPLSQLAHAVREVGDGGLPAAVPVDGVGEIAEVALAFNEMQAALTTRTGSLEKAVHELRDVNRTLRQAREGLDRAERLAMVGSMAAGVAHEVGNPMGALLAFLDVAARDDSMGENARSCLGKATEQGERVRVILRQLLDFSRAPEIQQAPFALDDVARQAVELVHAQREFASIEFEIDSDPEMDDFQCWGDRGLASQILLNLVMNAASELRDTTEAKIRIRLSSGHGRAREQEREGESLGLDGRKPDQIFCWVDDSGEGVTLDDPERIFDPFFTTKAPGEGTGLGLANARKLAGEMGGEVLLEADPSDLGGARFRFSLPREPDSRTPAH